jgi:hypothetical protein
MDYYDNSFKSSISGGIGSAYQGGASTATIADRRTFSGTLGQLDGNIANLGEALDKLESVLSPILRPTPPSPTGESRGGAAIASSASIITDQTEGLSQRVVRLHAKVIDLLQRVDL